MPNSSIHSQLSRRKVLAGLGVTGLALSQGASHVWAQNEASRVAGAQEDRGVVRCSNVEAMRALADAQEGMWIETLGFFAPGDGGGAHYQVCRIDDQTQPNGATPGGWLTTTAVRRAIDRIRREKQRDAKHQAALMYVDDTPHEPTGPVEDDRLRLLFTCCHPALAPEARIALTLRLLGGLTVPEIAQAFLVAETTMAQRITRAKQKIAAAKVPYRVPEAADLPERLGGVLAVLFLVFNEGYLATGDGDPVRAELTGEAIRLARILHRLLPEEPEVAGLLGLLLLTEARREARVRNGQLVPLDEQDRAGWDRALIAEGHDLVRECLAINRPGRYQILAAINAVHTDAPTASGHGLVPGRRALRPADPARPVADRRAQPRRRGRRAGRP